MAAKQLLTLALFLLGESAAAAAVQVSGTVYVDRDHDGVFSAGDTPVANAYVVYETTGYAATDAQGRYSLNLAADGIIWVRTPDGYSPTPVWKAVQIAGGDVTVDLPLEPATATGPVVFIDAADSHLGLTSDLDTKATLGQATALVPAPHFVTVVGDITDATADAQFQAFARARAMTELPFVPVSGNHDWYDGGAAYRRAFGPPSYSFDAGGVHFLVLNWGSPPLVILDFIRLDLSYPHAPVVAAFTHAPPYDAFAFDLAGTGIDYLFTGHAHSNRVMHHGAMTELNTEPLTFGGIDYTPAGYRVVSLVGGALRSVNHTIVDQPLLTLSFPRPGLCTTSGVVTAIAAAELGPARVPITLTVDAGAPTPLFPSGGWTFRAPILLPAGVHTLTLAAGARRQRFEVCALPAAEAARAPYPWPQQGGSAEHLGYHPVAVEPPMRHVWGSTVGGHIFGGSPVVQDGKVMVSVVDLDDGTAGGVVAFDARTGTRLWEARSGAAVRNAPAVGSGLVVFVAADGQVHAVELGTGEERWAVDLGNGADDLLSWNYSGPAIDRRTVYVAGQRMLAALDLATGQVLWSRDPGQKIWAVTLASPAVVDGIGVTVIGRGGDGVIGWVAGDGSDLWKLPPPDSIAVNASPLIDGHRVYLTNVASHVCMLDRLSGRVLWATDLYDRRADWPYGIVGTPALAGRVLFVPTPANAFVALDTRTGLVNWQVEAQPTTIRPLPYGKGNERPFVGAAAVTGHVVWAPGADGILRALESATGAPIWSEDLGSPILQGVAPSPPWVFVGAYDGTLHGFVSDPPPAPDDDAEVPVCAVAPGGAGGGPAGLAVSVLMGWAMMRRCRATSSSRGRRASSGRSSCAGNPSPRGTAGSGRTGRRPPRRSSPRPRRRRNTTRSSPRS